MTPLKSPLSFGVCGDLSMAAAAATAGFTYAEAQVAQVLQPRADDATFQAGLAAWRAGPLPCPVLNCFVPGDLKITGPTADPAALQRYVEVTMSRAEQAGIEIIVFGSGGARAVPEGFDPNAARTQLVEFSTMAARLAAAHGVIIVLEPLNPGECNVLNTVGECADFVREVDQPAFRLLADAYHMMRGADPWESIVTHGELLHHVHLATASSRFAPGAEPCDFAPFFQALARARYSGRVSIEGKIPDPATMLPVARDVMVRLATAAAA